MDCVEGCEFMRFKDGCFYCNYYDNDLKYYIEKDHMDGNLKIVRCEKCVSEGKIGSNTIQEKARKMKYRIGLMMDSFYSFKDDIEEEVTEIYRTLKELENEEK